MFPVSGFFIKIMISVIMEVISIITVKVLHSVAEFRNNAFELRRTMWTQVREDWPFFSEEQRCIVQRSFSIQAKAR